MNYTVDELTLMMIYNPGSRQKLIAALLRMRGELTESENELRNLTDSVLGKLEQLTDEQFDALPLYPDFDL